MRVIGLTGLMGSGKSLAASVFARLGAYVIDADRVSHGVLLAGGAAHGEVVSVFGDGIVGADGAVNRRALGEIVFADARKLEVLNSITHKYILSEIEREMRGVPPCYKAIVLEVILLYEANWHRLCDDIIVVTANRDTRIARVMARDGLTEMQAAARVSMQKPPTPPKPPLLLVNDGTREMFIARTEALARDVLG